MPAARPPWAAALERWYALHKRLMPWRGTRDPYPVWISEVMLQQTQVATATPYYQSFLRRFPTLADLAAARIDDVLHAWAGLGYYRRARHLHAAAQAVVREHHGRVPDDPEAFRKLPGVGRYTVGAVLSICFDRPMPVLDGNVARVLSRLEALPVAIKDARGARLLWERATALMPDSAPGDWNQAMMELGATICTPRAPNCDACPVRRWCRALALGRVEELPPAPKRRAAEQVRRAVVMVERAGKLLMVRREGSLLDGLWEPPGVELAGLSSATARAGVRAAGGKPANGKPTRVATSVADRDATNTALARLLRSLGVRATLERTGETLRHTITHRSIVVHVWRAALRGAVPRGARLRWVDPERPQVAITALARKLWARRITE